MNKTVTKSWVTNCIIIITSTLQLYNDIIYLYAKVNIKYWLAFKKFRLKEKAPWKQVRVPTLSGSEIAMN